MTAPRTYVAFVIDRSGSMDMVRAQAIESHNQQLRDIREAARDQEVVVIRTIFDYPTRIDISEPMPLVEVPNLNYESYVPEGSTALNDAIGMTIEKLRTFKLRKKDAVLLVIITDGQENSSVKFSGPEVKSMVKAAEETGQWTVTFLGANVDPFTINAHYGIHTGNIATYTASPHGVAYATASSTPSTARYFAERSTGSVSTAFYGENENSAPTDWTLDNTTFDSTTTDRSTIIADLFNREEPSS